MPDVVNRSSSTEHMKPMQVLGGAEPALGSCGSYPKAHLPLALRHSGDTIDLNAASLAHQPPAQTVQSIRHLLCRTGHFGGGGGCTVTRRLSSCELPRCLGSEENLPQRASVDLHQLLSGSMSAQSSLSCCTPSKGMECLECPNVPGLTWQQKIGSGSFARVYRGEWHGRPVAIKVLSSQRSHDACTGNLFESLLSANMHHPNVVKTYEVLTVQQPAASLKAPLSPRTYSDAVLGSTQACGEQAEKTDSVVGFLESLQISQQLPLDSTEDLLTPKRCCSNSFASAAATPFAAHSLSPFAAEEEEQGIYAGDKVPSLRGMLARHGFLKPQRAASAPLPPSPFDAAFSRAATAAAAAAGAGRQLISAGLYGGAAAPPMCGFSAEAPASGVVSSCWSGSSWGMAIGGTPSARSPLPESPVPPKGGTPSRGFPLSDPPPPPLPRGVFPSGSFLPSDLPPPPPQLQKGRTLSGGFPLPTPPPPPPPAGLAQVLLVMELATQNSLHAAISRGRLSRNLEAILLCAMDVAAGMAYLHSKGIVHADLKPANVLLMRAPVTPENPRGFTCKIADFGMARLLASGTCHAEIDSPGSLPYVAPEVLMSGKVTKPADVYSFAVLLLEMWYGRDAYTGKEHKGVLYSAFCGGRPQIPEDTPAAYRDLLQACWAADPAARPTFESAHGHFSSLLAAVRSGQ